MKQPIVLTALAASALVVGTLAWQQRAPRESSIISLQPVTVSKPAIDTTQAEIYLDPGMVRAMSTGNPMWPAALMVDDTPAHVMNTELTTVKGTR
jgi:hypothetical protein